MSLYRGESVLGLVRGAGRGRPGEGLLLEAVSPGFDSDPPRRGEFLLLQRSETAALVGRVVEARGGGPFAEGREQGAVYLAELLRAGAPDAAVPDDVRRMLHRLHLELRVLGLLELDGAHLRFTAGHRDLDPFGHRLRRPSLQALRFLASAGQEPGDGVVPFGHFSLGHEERTDVPVYFSVDRLRGRRSFVFARAGYGKSNLVKVLLSRIYAQPPEVGLLILDPEGEYAFRNHGVPGLADHPGIRTRLKVYTKRRDARLQQHYHDVLETGLRLDFRDCEPGEVLTAFVPAEKHEQVWSNYVRSLARRRRDGHVEVDDRWSRLVDLLDQRQYDVTDQDLAALIFPDRSRGQSTRGERDVSLNAIRNNLVPVIRRLHDPDSRLLKDIFEHLYGGGVAVLDVSLLSHVDARAIANLVLFKLFADHVKALTDGQRKAGILAVFEEAQTILSPREPDTSIFVRWVKEGRKYGLGALMITQQPGSIADPIVSQGDNFFVMHMLAQDDLDLLQRKNAHYTPDILDAIRSEPVKGNCYFWSAPDQPYVVPCRVANFDLEAPGTPPPALPAAETASSDRLALTAPQRALLEALAQSERVFLVTVKTLDGEPVSRLTAVRAEFLRQSTNALIVEAHGRVPDPDLPDPVDATLPELDLLSHPGRWSTDHPQDRSDWLVIDQARLAELSERAGLGLKPLKTWGLELRRAGRRAPRGSPRARP